MDGSLSLHSSRVSASYMFSILEKLRVQNNRKSTKDNYFSIWRAFNKFIVALDYRPDSWEVKVYLFVTHLVNSGRKSSTVKSYVSAIKLVLKDDGYYLSEDRILLNSLTRACRLQNDTVYTRLPINIKLLEILLFEIGRYYSKQEYLVRMYHALFCLAYYGMFRVGELGYSQHSAKAADIYMGMNKNKILVLLHSSKTHGKESRAQKIKITESPQKLHEFTRHFCPFTVLREFMIERGGFESPSEQFFIFRDGAPVRPQHIRNLLNKLLITLNLNHKLYGVHSFRIGHCTDLFKWGCSIPVLKAWGRWRE